YARYARPSSGSGGEIRSASRAPAGGSGGPTTPSASLPPWLLNAYTESAAPPLTVKPTPGMPASNGALRLALASWRPVVAEPSVPSASCLNISSGLAMSMLAMRGPTLSVASVARDRAEHALAVEQQQARRRGERPAVRHPPQRGGEHQQAQRLRRRP